MSTPRGEAPLTIDKPRVDPGNLLAGVALTLACVVLLGRIGIGLGFTDEMQYYGEIASLTRTGRFFGVDLFLQQLGYLFVLPFFKLHTLVFPGQDFLVLFGRGLLALGYGAVALIFWKGSGRLGGFNPSQRLVALAVLLAWVPFQIFALSYNSMAYLLLVVLIMVRLLRPQLTFRAYAWSCAALIAALAIVYPPAGAATGALAFIDIARRENIGRALFFAALVAGGVLASFGGMIALHGATFPHDLLVAYRFSQAFGVSTEIRQPEQLVSAGLIVVTTVLAIARLRPCAAQSVRAAISRSDWIVVLIAVAGLVAWWCGVRYKGGFSWTAGYVLLLLVLARGNNRAAPWATLAGGCGLCLLSVHWTPSGYFAAALYLLLLVLLASGFAGSGDTALRELVVLGAVLGLVFSITSGNGLHNFGVGAAAVLPFFVLYAARGANLPAGNSGAPVRIGALVAVVLLLLGNGLLFPLRKLGEPLRLVWLNNVPAFAGIATSSAKARVLHLVQTLAGSDALTGKPVLVAGPHPWIYFATRSEPATPMIFMHFTGDPKAYELLREHFFRPQSPEAIFITNPVPAPIQTKLLEWGRPGDSIRAIQIPDTLRGIYERQVTAELAPEIALLQRPAAPR